MQRKLGAQTLVFPNRPCIIAGATVVGPEEGEGPLADYYDLIIDDQLYGQKSWEASERSMMKTAVGLAVENAGLSKERIDFMLAGDLLNQLVSCNFAARDLEIPLLGLYGACSTFAQALGLAAAFVDADYATHAIAAVSSHYGTSERQFRFPTEYGGQRPPSAQHTVTGSGAALVAQVKADICITHFTIGKVLDLGIKDPYDMGSAMAPAAADTLQRHLLDSGRKVDDYDLILTGDLAAVGKKIMLELMQQASVQMATKYDDCGCLIYDRERQQVFAGGSGCACSAVVTLGPILNKMKKGELGRVLLIATGALLSPLTYQQGESIPGIAHAVALEHSSLEGGN